MGAIYDEFEIQLKQWQDRYSGQPRREMVRLCLLALEREELVSIAYREELMVKRLASMPIDKEVREIVRHALLWAWKDEEMHAIYIRGMILKLGSRRLKAVAYSRQMAGALGGWASSVRQHVRFRDAPFSFTLASLIARAGYLMGQVPAEVHHLLQYSSFRQFCTFNVDAEMTARLCWERLTDLAQQDPATAPNLIEDFQRVQTDELRHQQIFEILANVFDDTNHLVEGETPATLAARIATVSEFFVPRAFRSSAATAHPLGAGGKVWVAAGPSAVSPSTVSPSTAGPNTAGPSTVSPSTVSPSTVSPSTAGPNTPSPSTKVVGRAPSPAPDPLVRPPADSLTPPDLSTPKLALFRHLLDDAGLSARLRDRALQLGKPIDTLRIAIKPTFMMGYHRKDTSVITDPALVAELAAYLRREGCRDIAVVEGRNIYDQFYRHRSVEEVARYFQLESPDYRLVDGSAEQIFHVYGRGMGQYSIARTWSEADFRITFGKMRSHPIELAYLTTGNVEWMGGRCDEFMFPERQAERETAIMMLLDEFPPHYSLLDAYDSAADGLIGVMGCPHPPAPQRLYAGADALAVDMVAAGHLGVTNPGDSSILRAATEWFGNPAGRIEIIGVNQPISGWRGPFRNELSALLSFFAFPIYVFGSGRGSYFVPEMDEAAFPRIPCSRLVLLARAFTRRVLGLHHRS